MQRPGGCVFDNRNGFDYNAAPKTQLAALLGFTGLSLLAWAASASVAAANMHGWYLGLQLPPYLPSAVMLGRIWGVLVAAYLALGVAAWLIWRQPIPAQRQQTAMSVWGWQLALGAAWPAAFFGLHLLLTSAVLAAGLAAVTLATMRRFTGLNKTAGLLLLPYFGFALSAFYLNAGFWWLNH